MKLRVPQGCNSISYGGRELAIDTDCSVDVDERAARVLAAHGFSRFSGSEPEEARHGVGSDNIATLNRSGLFSLLRSKGVPVSLPITNEALRTAARKALER
jgi:hypothetical protein